MTEYYRPIPLASGHGTPGSYPLAGGPVHFSQVEVVRRGGEAKIVAAGDIPAKHLERLIEARSPIAGLSWNQLCVMGILNVTPDSFSDGGAYIDPATAVARAHSMVKAGADLIDIGGESTRPMAEPVTPSEETARVVPVIEALQQAGFAAPISLDTRNSKTAEACRVPILNDVSGLRHDPKLAEVAAGQAAALILMHSIGTPQTMQAEAAAAYGDVVLDVYDGLAEAIDQAVAAGVPGDQIMVDPGIGFGKTDAQNRALITRISLFHGLGCPILLGVSRKGFIGRLTGQERAADRDPASAGIGLWAASQGVQMLRVHDISLHTEMLQLWRWSMGFSDKN